MVPKDLFEAYVSMNYHWIERAQRALDRYYVRKTAPSTPTGIIATPASGC